MMERSDKSQPVRQFLAILYFGTIAMFFATVWDESASAWLRDHHVEFIEPLLSPSVFEGESLGVGDVMIFSLIICLVLYLIASVYEQKQRRSYMDVDVKWKVFYPSFFNTTAKMCSLRPQLGYILVNALCTAFLAVHVTKWVMARIRPGQVLREGLPYGPWYEVGPQFIAEGTYRGSLPSGHTALAMVTLGIAYCLIHCSGRTAIRYSGYLLYLATMVVAVLMALHRVMNHAHWLTDVVFALFMCLLITHWLFHWGMRVPERVGLARQNRLTGERPFSELLLCGYLTLFGLGIVLISFSVRSLLIPDTPLIAVLFPVGLGLCFFSMRSVFKLGIFLTGKKVRGDEK
ncbi:MAG: hypothetical protein CSB24_03575 [Deltaproteobacteria bacterium]|nr:MAG: hypothetical protein CSB24_03575 [Deltaproteobacteria bacterium]